MVELALKSIVAVLHGFRLSRILTITFHWRIMVLPPLSFGNFNMHNYVRDRARHARMSLDNGWQCAVKDVKNSFFGVCFAINIRALPI